MQKQRLCPTSTDGTVLKGGETVRLFQIWGGKRHYICQDCESWTSGIRESGRWVVDSNNNWFEFVNIQIELVQLPRAKQAAQQFEQISLLGDL